MKARSEQDRLKGLPKIDALLRLPSVESLSDIHGRSRVAVALRELVDDLRARLRGNPDAAGGLEEWRTGLSESLRQRLEADLESALLPVVNATGVLVHTNLGRAPLSTEAIRRIAEVAGSYSSLEYDLAAGRRGSRSLHAQRLLAGLFPGVAAHVVNNNAAAVLLALNTIAEGKEVLVSRGELVEIGGSFRIPDVMRKGQAVLREVGTTNRTRLSDYEEAITPETALLLKVHTSNYRIVGFTTQVSLADLAALGRRRGLPVMIDQGSGNLTDLSRNGIAEEPSVQELLAQGADLVTFSGDKLLGGPQAGILVGRAELVDRIRRNPLSRALRVDKLTYAALEATLSSYLTGRAASEIPILRMLEETAESIGRRVRRCVEALESAAPGAFRLEIVPGASLVGGGAAPTAEIPTSLLAVAREGTPPQEIERALRRARPPVIARIQEERLVLDLRTVPESQEADLVAALAGTVGRGIRR
jgi:L-seryl-tRNA(Ser) seleniumtransferase